MVFSPVCQEKYHVLTVKRLNAECVVKGQIDVIVGAQAAQYPEMSSTWTVGGFLAVK